MSNNRFDKKSNDVKLEVAVNYGSLEDTHNAVHVLVGGSNGGHMNNITVSAFDPIFWLRMYSFMTLSNCWLSVDHTWVILFSGVKISKLV